MNSCRHVLLLLLLSAVLLDAVALADDAPNLVANPGFEAKAASGLPEAWSGPANVYSHVSTPVHSGSGALQFVNPNAANYALCRQQIPLKVGRMYQFGVWVKCEDIVGDDSGATICLEWYTKDDKYLGGSYPAGLKGTQDWKHVGAISGRVPPTAEKCYVLCYVRQRMTGKAWWDDVEVKPYAEPPLQTLLVKPNYRGLITKTTPEIVLGVTMKLDDHDLKPAEVALRTELVQGEEVLRQSALQPKSGTETLRMSAKGLAPGRYQLRTSLLRNTDKQVLGSDVWRVEVPTAPLAERTSYIDEHNRLIVNGKPFFPLGMYWSSINEPDLKLYADSAFNCLMPYGMPTLEQMDLAGRYGQKVIYSIKDVYAGTKYCPPAVKTEADERTFIEAKTKQFKDHPALLAWYLNDELSVEYMPRLEAHQQWLEELDANHPTWIVLYQVHQLDLYRKTFDVLGTDPYPIPRQPAREAARYTILCRESTRGARPVWQVPQVMNWATYRKTAEEKEGLRPPTEAELRSMTWQCLTEGAIGLIYYSWFDLKKEPEIFDRRWAETKRVAAEVKQWIPVLLSAKPAPKITTPAQEWLHWMVRRVGNECFLFAVNDEEKPHEALFELPRGYRHVLLAGQEKPVTPAEGKLPVRLGGFELKVYRIGL